jgi:energy-coupling factor transporter ATP-binding protein EcfA2
MSGTTQNNGVDMVETYKATKTRSGRPGWSVTFKHPLRRDTRGKQGLKIRRGLNTADEAHADALVQQLDGLLSDRRWWSPDRRKEAEREFAPQIVSAFFDGMEVGRPDTSQLREACIPLPGRVEGYARVLLVGTTGAGKTTLLRHAIGSSHEQDRFPSTSTAKTTIADTEIITGDGPFEAAITFMSEFEVRAHIDECIEAACLEVVEDQSDEKIASALLTHREQRFRLSYVLGDWDLLAPDDDDEFTFDLPHTGSSRDLDEDEQVSEDDRKRHLARLHDFLGRIKHLAAAVAEQTEADFGRLAHQKTPDDKAAWLELYGDQLFDHEEFARLALDIKDDIEARFNMLTEGELARSETEWPLIWSFRTADRDTFLRNVRWFSSNHFRQFGRLLTPLVDGIRVRGPFRPSLQQLRVADRLVFIDGQGLGHTAESVSSVSTGVTKRFDDVDLIVLVDSAKQPMQAAPIALLRAAGSAGYAGKIALVFSNFDQVKGDNLQTYSQKRNHVLASVTNALASLRQALGAPVAAALERKLSERVFLLGALDRETDAIPPGILKEMARFLTLLQGSAAPEKPIESAPVYRPSGLELALRDAVDSFLRPWEARLGIAFRDGIRTEHWTRIKALSRRYANGWAWPNEYDNLRPASDLIARLQEEISRWLETPAGWTRTPADDDERMAALDPVRSAVFSALHNLARERLAEQHRDDWLTAFTYSGRGSGTRRAAEIRRIYEESAPPISSAMKPEARAFLIEVMSIVQEAVIKAGGRFEMSQAA